MNNWERYGHLAVNKDYLQVGYYYAGVCRNARIARWDGQRFTHWRDKCGKTFLEDIEYWDLNGTFDGFIPLFEIGPKLPKEIDIIFNKPFDIIINGIKKTWKFSSISYEDICTMIGLDPLNNPTITIAYFNVAIADRIITTRQFVPIQDGCIINAFYTGNS